MQVFTIDGQDYRLPNSLNVFQQALYVHLINWKWQHITTEPGQERGVPYDAILPDLYADQYPMLYPAVTDALAAAGACDDVELNRWMAWYQTLYNLH